MTKRRMPVRTAQIELDGEYEGFSFTLRTNAPLYVLAGLSSGDLPRITEALAEVLIDWNFPDENGDPLPPPSTETVGQLPFDLVGIIASHFNKEATSLPPA